MSKTIHHTGTIRSVGQGSVEVAVIQSSACSACHAAGLCHSAESKERVIRVATLNPSRFAVGQAVVVEGALRMGLKAVGLAYVGPLVVLMAAVTAAQAIGWSEPACALAGLASLVPYGIALWLFRTRLQSRFSFSVRPA
ncbi:MAG: SoxR reducing system RseC family protein [Bacteroidaceae bacterium]|nr:SoxR reducing system RseC family protein [Bacteroidaceae bacterium]